MNKPVIKRKIYNPYAKLEDHNCFGCSPKNHLGLKMEFYEEGDYICSEWEPAKHFGGYKNMLHGGVQATLMDELASWCIQIKLKTAGVTASMNVRYRNPAFTDKGKLLIKALVLKTNHNIVTLKTEIFDADNKLCSEAELKYFIYTKKIAREKLYYPEYKTFFMKP
jgi:uncharacterized protein (TIGR00369 family)